MMPARRTGGSVRSRLTVGMNRERSVTQMLPLYHEPHFTFRLADDRIIPAFTWRAWRPDGESRSLTNVVARSVHALNWSSSSSSTPPGPAGPDS